MNTINWMSIREEIIKFVRDALESKGITQKIRLLSLI
jgi:hypothetical protein